MSDTDSSNHWPIIPAIRVPDMREALAFYRDLLGFELEADEPSEQHNSLRRGSARLMLEVAADFYSDDYNAAIRQRTGTPSATTLYILATDLEELHARLVEAGVKVVDPMADRPWNQKDFTIEDHVGNWLTLWDNPEKRNQP